MRGSVKNWVERDSFHYGYLLDFYRRGARVCWMEDRGLALRNDQFAITYTGGEVPPDLPDLHGPGLVLTDSEALKTTLSAAHSDWLVLDTAQAVYQKPEPPDHEKRQNMAVRPLNLDDLRFVLEHYDNPGAYEAHIRERIEEGMIGGLVGGELAGFAGIHREGTMGLLEVLPAFRRRGLAETLEAALIAQQLRRGYLPYCHVRRGNTASERLQKKMGLRFDEESTFYWIGPE